MTTNSFGTRDRLTVGDTTYVVHRLHPIDGANRLPYSLEVLLENLARNEDGLRVTADQVSALASWDPGAARGSEIAYTPARSCELSATVRIDTPAEAAYFRHGGILPYVLRQLLAD